MTQMILILPEKLQNSLTLPPQEFKNRINATHSSLVQMLFHHFINTFSLRHVLFRLRFPSGKNLPPIAQSFYSICESNWTYKNALGETFRPHTIHISSDIRLFFLGPARIRLPSLLYTSSLLYRVTCAGLRTSTRLSYNLHRNNTREINGHKLLL